jgi:negative regulator of sigma E activity
VKTFIKVSIMVMVVSVFGTELLSADSDEPPQQPNPNAILQSVLEQFPTRPLELDGSLLIKNKKGFISHSYQFHASININAEIPTAKYSFFIPEAKSFFILETSLQPDGTQNTIFKKGNPSKQVKAPPLDSPILGSDITWENLSFQFLKWTNVVYVGSDTVLGLKSSIIKLYPTKHLDTVHYKIWVANKNHALMRFQEYDADNKLKRTIWIKSLKKIDGGFTVKDLEAEAFPVMHRTKIKINSFIEVGE